MRVAANKSDTGLRRTGRTGGEEAEAPAGMAGQITRYPKPEPEKPEPEPEKTKPEKPEHYFG